MAEREKWLEEEKMQNGVAFTVVQRRTEPLKVAIVQFLITAGLALVALICFKDMSTGGLVGGLVFGLFAAFFALCTLMTSLIVIPMVLFSSGESRFTVTPNAIVLDKKYKSQYPEELTFANISEYYVLPPYGRKAETTVTIASEGSFGKAGNAAGEQIAKSRYALAVNHRGKELILSGLLSYEEANFLYSRFEAALNQCVSH